MIIYKLPKILINNKIENIYKTENMYKMESICEKERIINLYYKSMEDLYVYMYKILVLYNCFLDGWNIKIENYEKIKLVKELNENFNMINFINNNYLLN